MLTKSILACGAFSVVLVLLTNLTNPENVHAFVFIVIFALIFGLLYSLAVGICAGMAKLEIINWLPKKIYRIAAIAASLPFILLIIQSLGQLTGRDVLLVGLLFGLGYFYFSRTRRSTDT